MNNAIIIETVQNTPLSSVNVTSINWSEVENKYNSLCLKPSRKILTRKTMNRILVNTIGWALKLKPISVLYET